jgi:hypothetical protein
VLYRVAIFVSAFLLFSVQLILGKAILPWFGGTPAVWTTCLMFFQIVLLAGYGYAHFSIAWLSARRQARVHAALLLLAVASLGGGIASGGLPLLPGAAWKPESGAFPVPSILAILGVSVLVPYLALASTSPLLAAWYARVHDKPYRLYALSNLGSLLGLVSYPFLVERFIGLHSQVWSWSALFLLYVLSSLLCARAAVSGGGEAAPRPPSGSAVPWARRMYWLLLSATGSMLLLSTSNHLGEEVSVSPLLWMLPLTVYLITFILCFEREGVYRRPVFAALFAGALLLSTWTLREANITGLEVVVGGDLLALFCGCMICHGELVLSKPGAGNLTLFYLMVSAGGAIGGFFVSICAPVIFQGFWELQLSLWLCAVLLLAAAIRDPGSWIHRGARLPAALTFLVAGTVLYVGRPQFFGSAESSTMTGYGLVCLVVFALGTCLVLIISSIWRLGLGRRRAQLPLLASIAAIAGLGAAMENSARQFGWARIEYAGRNFYGVQRVIRDGQIRILAHGATLHGWELMTEPHTPLGYYAAGSGIAAAIRDLQAVKSPLRMAVVGLGSGALAGYGRPGDLIRYFEIDPQVIALASGAFFTYLPQSRATVSIVEGDARLSLERDQNRYDLLVLDAFSSDVIPVHLMTREAFDVYLAHLSVDGVLAVHISNRYLDLGPTVRRLCDDLGLHAVFVVRKGQDPVGVPSVWVLASRDARFLQHPTIRQAATPQYDRGPSPVVWTDDWSNVLDAVRR